jgi:succinate-semialdehyde dehydrogenase/glutarate-semialdehyde dehydrogenase
MSIRTLNPATGETLKTFEALTDAEIDDKLQCAAEMFRTYRHSSLEDRAEKMLRAAEILETEKEHLGCLATLEMGKTLKAAIEEVAKCSWVCRYYAEHAKQLLADEMVESNATHSFVRYQPLGLILAIMPWNFPFWQVFRFAAPALMAGNVGLLKHASSVPQCALAIEDVLARAGFPQGVFQTLLVGSQKAQQIIEDRRVAAVTLTGSEPAGQSVGSQAGKHIKKAVLELGGSDPFIVMPSADLDVTVQTAVKARMINNGQSCIAAKRFIVAEQIADEFEQRFVQAVQELKVGDPMDQATDVGPLANEDIINQVNEQVEQSVEQGAQVLIGGKRLNQPGYYFAPTILTNIPKEAPAYHEEVFGPVALLFRVRDIDEAIELANDTRFGLGSSAWTNDQAERERFIDDIEAGQVFINGMVASDPRLPFGGVKHSGYGRELSVHGIREFCNIKTVWIKDQPSGKGSETE